MKRYKKTFLEKDTVRFKEYIVDVMKGKRSISGAALTPASLVAEARRLSTFERESGIGEVLGAQWETLVESVRETGKMGEAMAVADVSGSMREYSLPSFLKNFEPHEADLRFLSSRRARRQFIQRESLISFPPPSRLPSFSLELFADIFVVLFDSLSFKDRTAPIDSSIGLALLLATVAPEPFQGTFITFSGTPEIIDVNLESGFVEIVKQMERADWGQNTE